MRDVKVQFGDFEDLFGAPGHAEGITFVPCTVRLHGEDFKPDHYLGDLPIAYPAILLDPIAGAFDAAWVRARIPQIFDYTPGPLEDQSHLFHMTFLAVEVGSFDAFPFHCAEFGGRSALVFSPAGPSSNMQEKIAQAFWNLFLHAPEELADFSAEVATTVTGRTLTYGCRDGKPFVLESEDR